MWRKPGAVLTFAVLASPYALAAPPKVLLDNQTTLGYSFAALTVAVVILGFSEWKNRGQSLDLEIDRLAAAAAQRQAKVNTDASGLLDEPPTDLAKAAQQEAPSSMMAPPPPPPTAVMAPPPPPAAARNSAPPPPPPPPSPPPPPPAGDGDNFAARLAASQDSGAIKVPPKPPAPISFGNTGAAAPPPPPSTESGSTGAGGWADLLQRVRSNEGDAPPPNPFKPAAASTPSTEEEAPKPPAPAGGDAWEALLRKTAGGASGETSSPFAKSGSVELPSNSPFAKPNTGPTPPNPEPGRASEDDAPLPDFVKKASRTISLDLNKGSGGSNPFQKPPQ